MFRDERNETILTRELKFLKSHRTCIEYDKLKTNNNSDKKKINVGNEMM